MLVIMFIYNNNKSNYSPPNCLVIVENDGVIRVFFSKWTPAMIFKPKQHQLQVFV